MRQYDLVYAEQSKATEQKSHPIVYELPIVFHVIHQNGDESLSDLVIENGLESLNAAFSNNGYYDQGEGVDTEIGFCLALVNDDQIAERGIVRVQSGLTDFYIEDSDDELKALSRWSPYDYINVYVVKEIRSHAEGNGLAGYAYLPSAHGQSYDGIVIEARYFSSEANLSVLVHEMGHYLGLYHTFLGGCLNADCGVAGDAVCDTPPDNSTARLPCSEPNNSCVSDTMSGYTLDQPDMINNYMDYSEVSCYNAFTKGQKQRMQRFVTSRRKSLLSSNGCKLPCLSKIELGNYQETYNLSTTDQLSLDMIASGATSVRWYIDEVLEYTTAKIDHQFQQAGKYELRFEAENGADECRRIVYITVDVACIVKADMSFSQSYYTVGESIELLSKSENYSELSWTVNGIDLGDSQSIEYLLSTEGVYEFCIEATDGFCDKTYCKSVLVLESFGLCNRFSGFSISSSGPENAFLDVDVYGDGFVALANLSQSGFVLVHMDFDLNVLNYDTYIAHRRPQYGKLLVDGNFVYIALNNVDESYLRMIKFNLLTKANVWDSNIAIPDLRILSDILRNGNQLFVLGDFSGTLGCDGLLIEIEDATGDVIEQRGYNLGSCESFSSSIMRSDHIITTGRYNYAGGGQSKMRHSVSRLGLDGEEQWSRLIGKDLDSEARLYTTSVINTSSGMAMCGFGDHDGISSQDIDLIFYTTNDNGILQEYKSYKLKEGQRQKPITLIEDSDNYYLVCTKEDLLGEVSTFILSLDEHGDFISAYELPPYLNKLNGVTHLGDQLVMVGSSGHSQSSSPVIISLDLPLSLESTCDPMKELDVEEVTVDHFSTDTNLEVEKLDFVGFSGTTILNAQNYYTREFCRIACEEICGNNEDDNEDGLTDCEDPIMQDSCCCLTPVHLDLGPDMEICDDEVVTLSVNVTGESIIWNDGLSLAQREIYEPGEFWVEVVDSCGVVQRDSVILSVLATNRIDLGQDTAVCRALFAIGDTGFDSYSWYHNRVKVDCMDCDSLTLELTEGMHEIISVGTNLHGCTSIDTLRVEYTEKEPIKVDLGADVTICAEDYYIVSDVAAVIWQDDSTADSLRVYESGLYSATSYDSKCSVFHTDTIIVSFSQQDTLLDHRSFCQGDSILVHQVWRTEAGTYEEILFSNASSECDTVIRVNVVEVEHTDAFLNLAICEGDSIQIGEHFYSEAGDYSVVTNNLEGCDSLIFFSLKMLVPSTEALELSICDGIALEVLGERISIGGEYELITQNVAGCDSTLHVQVSEEGIYVPNVFDISGISNENVFMPHITCSVESYELAVYDRWGGKVFYTTDVNEGWYGKQNNTDCAQGVYTYLMELEVKEAKVTIQKFGTVTLLR